MYSSSKWCAEIDVRVHSCWKLKRGLIDSKRKSQLDSCFWLCSIKQFFRYPCSIIIAMILRHQSTLAPSLTSQICDSAEKPWSKFAHLCCTCVLIDNFKRTTANQANEFIFFWMQQAALQSLPFPSYCVYCFPLFHYSLKRTFFSCHALFGERLLSSLLLPYSSFCIQLLFPPISTCMASGLTQEDLTINLLWHSWIIMDLS